MKNFHNPLFENLLQKANVYGRIEEQGDPKDQTKGNLYDDFAKSMIIIGTKFVENYLTAITGYPETPLKNQYLIRIPDRLNNIANSIDETKTVEIQLNALLDSITKELQDFLAASQKDGLYAKHLRKWRDTLRSAFDNYKSAILECIKEAGKNQGRQDPGPISKRLKPSILRIKSSFEAELENKKRELPKENLNSSIDNTRYNRKEIIEKLIDKGVAVDFDSFVSLSAVNEGAKGEAKRNAKALLASINSTIGSINGVLSQIYAREGDPRRKDFRSIQMKPTFFQIAGNIEEIRSQITIDGLNLKDRKELVNLPLDQLEEDFKRSQELFTTKKEEYEKSYISEESDLKSIKTIDVISPSINDKVKNGDLFFNKLGELSMLAGQLAQEEINKEKEKKPEAKKPEEVKDPVATLKIRDAIKKGTKSEEVKKFQELVVDKMKDLKGNTPFDQLAAASKQFGSFGPKTAAAVKFLKAGFGIQDKTSDITQELIDKIASHDGKIKESYSLFEEFDLKAANASISGNEQKKEIKKIGGDDIKSAKKDLAGVKNEISKDVPKIPSGDVKKHIEEAVSKAKEEWNKEQAIKELKEIGAKENPDYGKNGQMAVATANGIRFYSNGTALRLFDKMLGTYSVKNDRFVGVDGSKDKLTALMRDGIPYKYADGFRMFYHSPADACKKYITWDEQSVTILDSAFKAFYKKSLDKHLASKLAGVFSGVNSDIDTFRKKFVSVIS